MRSQAAKPRPAPPGFDRREERPDFERGEERAALARTSAGTRPLKTHLVTPKAGAGRKAASRGMKKSMDAAMRGTYNAKTGGNKMGNFGGAASSAASRSEAQHAISKKRDELNLELMRVLEEETQAEALRENKLKQCADETEHRRLEKIFGIERAKASERIIQTSDRHDGILRKEMDALGITF